MGDYTLESLSSSIFPVDAFHLERETAETPKPVAIQLTVYGKDVLVSRVARPDRGVRHELESRTTHSESLGIPHRVWNLES